MLLFFNNKIISRFSPGNLFFGHYFGHYKNVDFIFSLQDFTKKFLKLELQFFLHFKAKIYSQRILNSKFKIRSEELGTNNFNV